jgi:hypothetical protein
MDKPGDGGDDNDQKQQKEAAEHNLSNSNKYYKS